MATMVEQGVAATDTVMTDPIHQILEPSTDPSKGPAFAFTFGDFLRREYRFGLDPNRPMCKAFVQGHCPQGNACPDKHTASSNFNNLVCKHWLRGLCKKGDACEFLHEYNLRKMPECNFFRQHKFCPNGEECLYLHLEEDSRRDPCPHYDKGFCPLGPRCGKKHERKNLCRFYLAGFCPNGRSCKEGAHPRWPTNLPPPTALVKKDAAEIEAEALRRQEKAEQHEESQRERGFGRRGDWGGRGGGRGRASRGRRGGF